ncbi:MAG: lipopolysaccharide biosynthesis protein [Flavobacteriales bacterium]
MNPFKKLARQTVIYGLSSVVGRLLNYLLVPLYTRYFLPEEYGIVTELYAYVAFLVVILTYGIETAFFRYSQKVPNKRTVYSTALISLLITSAIFVFIIFSSAAPIANWLQYPNHSDYIQYFALIIGLDAISAISFAKLREKNKATRFALIRLVNIFLNIGLNLFFIIYCPYALEKGLSSVDFVNSVYSADIGIGYIFIANLIASIVTFLMLFPEMIKSVWIFDKSLWKQMMIYGLPLLIAGLAGMTNETIDRILLKHLLPTTVNASSELGLYGAFYKLSILMILFIQTFRFAAEPFFFAQEKEKNARKIYADVMKYFVIITSVIFLGVSMFYDFIILFLGENYHDERGFMVVSILLAANLFLGIYYNLSIWYKLSEKTKYGAYLSIFGAIITLCLNFILIPKIGFVGSAWATLICYFSMMVASYFLGKKHYKIPYPLKRIFFYLGLVCVLYLTSIYFDSNIINSLYILIFISIAFYLEKPKKAVISNPKLFD